MVDVTTKALAIKYGDDSEALFDAVFILIPTDPHYKQCDCGKLAPALSAAFDSALSIEDRRRVFVNEIVEGDNNVGVLNAYLDLAAEGGFRVMFINSPSASGYLTPETAVAMFDAWAHGADVVDGVVPEAPHPVLARKGFAQNTLIAWHVEALKDIDGFNPIAAIAPIGVEPNPNADCEEIPSLLRMAEVSRRPFIALIEPRGEFGSWKLPPEGSEDRVDHDQKQATKFERIKAHADFLGKDLGILEKMIMPEYKLAPLRRSVANK